MLTWSSVDALRRRSQRLFHASTKRNYSFTQLLLVFSHAICLSIHPTENHKSQPHGAAGEKESAGLIVSATWMSAPHFKVIHPVVVEIFQFVPADRPTLLLICKLLIQSVNEVQILAVWEEKMRYFEVKISNASVKSAWLLVSCSDLALLRPF